MKNLASAGLLVAAVVGGIIPAAIAKMPAGADTAAPAFAVDKVSFLKQVESSNVFEIESSKLAEQKAKDPDVKDFAMQMVADHTNARAALKKAAKLGVDAPMLSPKHAAMLETLKGASEQDFQPLYIDMQASAHNEAVSLFATYATAGDDRAVRAFAMKTLPTLEVHKAHVQKLVTAH